MFTAPVNLPSVVMIGLDRKNFNVNEANERFEVCVVLLEGSGIEDEDFSIPVSISVSSENATGIALVLD